MAFTKITNAGFGLTTGTLVGVAASFSSTVSVGGTLTYEDVTNVDSVGLITARNGIEVTDKGVQVGTGATVDSAAANTLTFLTGGSERARIDSSGKMGLGTNSPSQNLHIYQATGDDVGIRIQNSDGFAELEVDADELNYNADSHVFNNQADSAERMRIDGSGNVQVSAGQFTVGTTASTGLQLINDGTFGTIQSADLKFRTAATERMRIDTSGNLGLGEDSPQKRLHVSTSGSGIQEVQWLNNAQAVGADVGSALVFTGTSSNNGLARIQGAFQGSGTGDGGYLTFDTRAVTSGTLTERLRITAAGQLLINTTSPANSDTNIEVHDTSVPEFSFARNDTSITAGNGIGRIRWYGNDSNGTFQECARISASADGTHQTDDKATRLTFWTTEGGSSTPTERLRIHQQGHGEFHNGAITRVVVGDDVSLSGASQVVTGIPSWATKITIILYRASLNGTQDFLVQLRAGGSDISSNYNSVSVNHTGATVKTSTDGFIIANTNASHKTSGHMVIERVGTDTKWVATHMVLQDGGPAPRMGAGDLSSYSGTIDGIKIKDTGNNSYDNGTITVIAEA